MSRVISTEIAALKANQENLDAKNSAMASDAFFHLEMELIKQQK